MAKTIEWNWDGSAPAIGDRVVREGHGGRWRLLAEGEAPENPAGVFFGIVTGIVESGVEIEME